MSLGYISGYDFGEMEVMKYYSPPASWSEEKKKDTVRNRIFSGEWLAAEKKDGFFGKLVKDDEGNVLLYTRSRNTQGKFTNKYDWVPQLHDFFSALPNGTCLLGEMYLPSQPGSKNVQTILGCLVDKAIDRQAKGEKIHFYVFDCLAFGGLLLNNKGYKVRAHYVQMISKEDLYQDKYVTYGQFYSGADLWEYLQEVLADGKEGVVIMHQDGVYEPGKRPSKTTLKVKQELKQTIDCVIIGANSPTKIYTGKSLETWKYWINDITEERLPEKSYIIDYNDGKSVVPVTKNYYLKRPGSFKIGLFDAEGTLHHYGDLSGLSDEELANYKEYIGRVCEVGGMMLDSESKAIRHPKLIRWRDPDEKSPKECTEDQLYN